MLEVMVKFCSLKKYLDVTAVSYSSHLLTDSFVGRNHLTFYWLNILLRYFHEPFIYSKLFLWRTFKKVVFDLVFGVPLTVQSSTHQYFKFSRLPWRLIGSTSTFKSTTESPLQLSPYCDSDLDSVKSVSCPLAIWYCLKYTQKPLIYNLLL